MLTVRYRHGSFEVECDTGNADARVGVGAEFGLRHVGLSDFDTGLAGVTAAVTRGFVEGVGRGLGVGFDTGVLASDVKRGFGERFVGKLVGANGLGNGYVAGSNDLGCVEAKYLDGTVKFGHSCETFGGGSSTSETSAVGGRGGLDGCGGICRAFGLECSRHSAAVRGRGVDGECALGESTDTSRGESAVRRGLSGVGSVDSGAKTVADKSDAVGGVEGAVRSVSGERGSKVESSEGCLAERGPNWERNRAWKAEKKRKREQQKDRVPAWRVGAKPLSPPSTVVTVDSRTAEEIEAARSLAVRRTFENKLAVVKTKHQLASYADKDKTEAIKRLEVARIEERINTTKAKSQASYKKCDTPLNSVGSAGSAGEFAWKQEIRKRDAVIKERDYYEQQLEVAMKYLSDAGKRAIAELPEPYIPTLEDIEFEDADISPYYSREEMEAEAAKWVGDEAW